MGKHKKEKSKKSKKRSRSSSSSSSEYEKKKKRKKKDKKGLKSIDDIIKERLKNKPAATKAEDTNESQDKKMAPVPMTKEEYDKKQSVVKRVFDEDTGRMRLVKGDGEIIEEIVSASRQKEINKMATKSDGQSFQASLNSKLK